MSDGGEVAGGGVEGFTVTVAAVIVTVGSDLGVYSGHLPNTLRRIFTVMVRPTEQELYDIVMEQGGSVEGPRIRSSVAAKSVGILILLTFATNSSLRKAQHLNFLNLALCDFIIACVALPSRLTLDLYGCWPAPYVFCRIYKLLDWIITSEASFTVILIAIARYQMITRGAVYRQEETSRRVLIRIAVTWVVNVLLYGPVQFVDLYTGISTTGKGQCNTEFFQYSRLSNLLVFTNNIIPPVIVIIIYVLMFTALRRKARMIVTDAVNPMASVGRVKENRPAKHGRALMLLTVCFLVTSCPVGIISVVMFATSSLSIHCAYSFLLYLLYSNSLLNTLVYTSKVPALKFGVRKMFCLCVFHGQAGTVANIETRHE